ncbi:L-2-hydroxyglutarate oxidase LhgO [Candidatus Methylomirabilis lanthanidiphila]|uniref:L-2-hydroxyglutarate oxidase LhgO n=1 Tax=Candidatus Methylomirabilis lanthanidiphila TaxID=2211376 RepID=A0A564ZJR0_9BACT|nr:L-2-hydroxyglutarate oxidase LhgO [Candidatus Methylomirabilis lanthanidiphila]
MGSVRYDVAVVGGGIVGMAVAMTLVSRWRLSLVVLEAEDRLAAHQSGHNSGVIHSGLYYKPGSLKARLCTEGREAMFRFCQAHGIPYERCGKLVIATTENELPLLNELEQKGDANGLRGLRRLGPEEIREYEPHAAGIAGLSVPETGIVDYTLVTHAFADLVRSAGGKIHTAAQVSGLRRKMDELLLETTAGEVCCRYLINCGGLQSDRIARMSGVNTGLQIIPFRGEYYELVPDRRFLVNNLIYPVPDPRFPFLGVHFTRTVHGGVEAGPNAVLAFKRNGYQSYDLSLTDAQEMVLYGGFWRMSRRYWKTGVGELRRSLSKRAFVRALQRLIPELGMTDLHRAGAGVRAQAVEPTGALVDDFRIVEAERMIHVLNAPSPAATGFDQHRSDDSRTGRKEV